MNWFALCVTKTVCGTACTFQVKRPTPFRTCAARQQVVALLHMSLGQVCVCQRTARFTRLSGRRLGEAVSLQNSFFSWFIRAFQFPLKREFSLRFATPHPPIKTVLSCLVYCQKLAESGIYCARRAVSSCTDFPAHDVFMSSRASRQNGSGLAAQ